MYQFRPGLHRSFSVAGRRLEPGFGAGRRKSADRLSCRSAWLSGQAALA